MFPIVFFKTVSGNDVVRDFIRDQPAADRKILGDDLRALQFRYPLGLPLCRALKSGLWELRSSLPSKREVRLLYFFDSKRQAIVVVFGFVKKTRTTPSEYLQTALKRMGNSF